MRDLCGKDILDSCGIIEWIATSKEAGKGVTAALLITVYVSLDLSGFGPFNAISLEVFPFSGSSAEYRPPKKKNATLLEGER